MRKRDRIEKLSKREAAAMAGWAQTWIENGLRPGPTTQEERERFERAVRVWYEAAGLAPPRRVVWVQSPLVGAFAAPIAAARLATPVGDKRPVTLGEDELRLVRDGWHRRLGGHMWVGWWWGPACQTFLRDVCGLRLSDDLSRRLDAHVDVCETAGWWWPYRGFVIACERHTSISRDEQGRLHSLTGPSIAWADGWALHHIHGVRVPAYVVEHPEQITVGAIESETNAEVRRVMAEQYGLARYVRDAAFQVIDQDTDSAGQPRRLLSRGDMLVVELVNSTVDADGTRRVYHVPVHPECRPLLEGGELGLPQPLSARNATASTYGMTGDEYARLTLET